MRRTVYLSNLRGGRAITRGQMMSAASETLCIRALRSSSDIFVLTVLNEEEEAEGEFWGWVGVGVAIFSRFG